MIEQAFGVYLGDRSWYTRKDVMKFLHVESHVLNAILKKEGIYNIEVPGVTRYTLVKEKTSGRDAIVMQYSNEAVSRLQRRKELTH